MRFLKGEAEFIVDIPVTVRARIVVTDDEYYQRAHAQDVGKLIVQRMQAKSVGTDGVEMVRITELPWMPELQEADNADTQ